MDIKEEMLQDDNEKYNKLIKRVEEIEKAIMDIENCDKLFLDEINFFDKEIIELSSKKEKIKKLPQELKDLKKELITGSIVCLLASLVLSVLSTENTNEISQEILEIIIQKILVIYSVLETSIAIPGIKGMLELKKEIKNSESNLTKIQEKIKTKQEEKERLMGLYTNDLSEISTLNNEKEKILKLTSSK